MEKRFKKFYIHSGIYGGILLDADDFGRIDGVYFERDKDGRYSLLDVGILAGLGKRIPLSEKSILKIGLIGNLNVTGNDGRGMTPGYEHHWYNQSYNLEIRFERRI